MRPTHPVDPRPTRPAPRRRFRPEVRGLEPRTLLSAAGGAEPTADEQSMLELINRARSDPPAEARRLQALTRTDPAVGFAVASLGAGGFASLLDATGPLPPLAFNPRLIEAARAHDADMGARDAQFHSPTGYLTDPAVARADDGAAYFPTGAGPWAVGENVFSLPRGTDGPGLAAAVDLLEAGLMIDWGNPDLGHLRNLMAPGPAEAASGGHTPYSEIGIGLLAAGPGAGSVELTQEFGWRVGPAFLTGVAYRDGAGDGSYRPGEGLGGETIRAVGREGEGTYQARTWGSGGYSLALPSGTYDVTATGPAAAPRSRVVTIGADNVAWDIRVGAAASDIRVASAAIGPVRFLPAARPQPVARPILAGAVLPSPRRTGAPARGTRIPATRGTVPFATPGHPRARPGRGLPARPVHAASPPNPPRGHTVVRGKHPAPARSPSGTRRPSPVRGRAVLRLSGHLRGWVVLSHRPTPSPRITSTRR